MDGALVVFTILIVAFVAVDVFDALPGCLAVLASRHTLVGRRQIGLDFRIVRVLVAFIGSIVALRRGAVDLEIVGVFVV
jgi:hypothetical protein